MLADLLTERKEYLSKYHEHDSLLENKVDEDLTEEERKAAWEEYEQEKKTGFRTVVRGGERSKCTVVQSCILIDLSMSLLIVSLQCQCKECIPLCWTLPRRRRSSLR